MASFKRTFAPRTFAARTFGAAAWRGAGPAIIDGSDAAGIEYRAGDHRLHYVAPNGRLHYRSGDYRLTYTSEEH
jgi:hypothetical protein